jgi:PAS domain S-box-containing protein
MDLSIDDCRELLDTLPDALIVTDEAGTVVYANAQAGTLFGVPRSDLLGTPVDRLVPARLRERHAVHRHDYAEAPRVRPMGDGAELRAERRDGTEFPVEIRLSPMRRGRRTFVSTVIRDATERHAIHAALVAARTEADHANRAKSAFLAAASHDLRQPLQTLELLNGVLARMPQAPAAREAIDAQAAALASVSELLNALLDVSKLDSGAIKPDIHDVAVQAIFDRLRATFAEQARAKGLSLLVEDTPAVVRSDPRLLERIVQNLVVNAIRYTRHGSVRLRCCAEPALERIEVEDTGIGIPADQFEAIFEEFRQLEPPPGSSREGLGLGLSIVRKMAALLEHTIEVHSTPGLGSCFAVRAHRAAGTDLPVAGPRAAAPAARRARVLVVDDDESIGAAVRLLLRTAGYQPLVANGLSEALAAADAAGGDVALLLCDYRLEAGAQTGRDVVERIRAHLGRAVPAILMSGDTSGVVAADAAGVPDCGLLAKPFSADAFLDAIAAKLTTP